MKALACASCGCSVNTDWGAQGLSATPGWSLDLRYDYLNQNKLWSGRHAISPAVAAVTTNTQTGGWAEVEQYTKNHYLTATIDYSNGSTWGASLIVPYIDRSHGTLGSGSDGITFDPANGAYTSSGSGFGDVKVIGRYYGFSERGNFGIQFGMKLPTGKKDQVANDGSTPVDPGLQPGTGTTDVIIGAYYFNSLGHDWGYFTQATFQAATNHSGMAAGTYKPGNSVNLAAGTRYMGFGYVVPTVQLNVRYAKTDSGSAADAYATGGTLAYLTLGVLAPISGQFSPYINLQLPVYQNLNGIQLAPKYIFSAGARYVF